jgi:hypothetical protein
MIVDTHAAHRAGSAAGNSHFFNQRAMAHIARCLELMRALDLPFNLRTAYNLLANKDHLKNTLDTVPEHPRAKELYLQHPRLRNPGAHSLRAKKQPTQSAGKKMDVTMNAARRPHPHQLMPRFGWDCHDRHHRE